MFPLRLFKFCFAGILVGLAASNARAQDLSNLKNEKWATLHGSVGATAYIYNMDGAPARRVPLSYILSGNATLTLKGVSLPFSFQYSEQQRDFRQPFNQFGVSPTYKWIRVHLGYRNVSFSRYTLDGHRFLGAGIELNPGKFRFGAVYGRFLRAVPEDSSRQVTNSVSQYPVAAYDRYGYGIKIGVGTANTFFDLVYFKGKDDSSSVRRQPEIQLTAPSENASLGFRTRVTLFKKLSFEADAAASVYTRDQRADSILLEQVGWQKEVSRILVPRLSTNIYYAGDASLGWRDKNYSLALKYTRVLPDYRSMGTYFLQTDVERYTFSPAFNSKKGTIQASGSIGFEHDNLQAKKLAQTKRVIGAFSANYAPTQAFGIGVQYANFGITQRPGLRSLTDTITIDQVTQSIMLSPRYTLTRDKAQHTFLYLFSNQSLNDRNRFASQDFGMTNINNTLSYVLYLTKSGLSIDASAYQVNTTVSVGQSTSLGGSAGINKGFLENRLTTGVSANYSSNSFEGAPGGSTLQMRGTGQYTYSKRHRLRADYVFTSNESATQAVNRAFRENLLTLQYAYSF